MVVEPGACRTASPSRQTVAQVIDRAWASRPSKPRQIFHFLDPNISFRQSTLRSEAWDDNIRPFYRIQRFHVVTV